jgi:hypothetical protein
MTACGEIGLLLGPFEDGELEPHEMEDVALHVVSCGDCKEALEDYRALGVGLRDAVTVPSLDGFARTVVARLRQRRLPLRIRVGRWWEPLARVASLVEFASVAAATAILTMLIAGPDIRQFVARKGAHQLVTAAANPVIPNPAAQHVLAASQPEAPGAAHVALAAPDQNLANLIDETKLKAAGEMQEMISEMGAGQSPAVAVWNEPNTHTTVVWIPDQP